MNYDMHIVTPNQLSTVYIPLNVSFNVYIHAYSYPLAPFHAKPWVVSTMLSDMATTCMDNTITCMAIIIIQIIISYNAFMTTHTIPYPWVAVLSDACAHACGVAS